MAEKEEKKEDKKAEKKAAKAAEKEAKRQEKEQRKQEEKEQEEEETTGGKILIGVVAVFIVLIWLLILGLLIKMDVGGFGSTVLYPVLKDVPVVNKILPDVKEYAKEDEAYTYDSVEDAVKRIKELENEVAELKSQKSDNDAHVADLETQAAELKAYKDNEDAFEAKKQKFYEEVVFSDKAPDINSYKEYYESIEPANAEAIYKQVVQQQQQDSQVQEYADTYAKMKPANAAAILNTMKDDLPLVGKILWAMDTKSRASILGAMDKDIAAAVTKLM
ncbi:MAG: hypothetical protein PUB19_10145, partial [Lachnospiraceae bacterium]|nr:hypothetical protein [Lachnospiraceae bacterium]